MAQAAKDLLAQKSTTSLPEALRHLIRAESCERQIRSIQNRTKIAKFPHHKDFATFDFETTPLEQLRIKQLATGQFTQTAQKLILVGGICAGKTHIAIALGTAMIERGQKIRFFNTVNLINALIKEDKEGNKGNSGRLQRQLLAADCVIMDE